MNPKDRVGVTKPNLSVIPLAPLYEIISAFVEGARKYGPWNWRKEKVSETIYVDAAIRHLNQWLSGETIDPDSGVSHITKAIAGLIILRDAQIHDCSIDDRGPVQKIDIAGVMTKLATVVEKYPNPVGEQLHEQVSTAPRLVCDVGPRHRLTLDDIGCEVILRDGSRSTLESSNDFESYPFAVDTDCCRISVDYEGRQVHKQDKRCDVVKIFRKPKTVQCQVPEPTGGRRTIVGGGSSRIKKEDAGCAALTRRGERVTITEFCGDAQDIWPVAVDYESGPCYVDVNGRYDADGSDDDDDIVEVFRSVEPEITYAGGGKRLLDRTDYGRRVLLRNGTVAHLCKSEHSYLPFRVDYVDEDGDNDYQTTTTGGFASSHAGPSTRVIDRQYECEHDVVEVLN